MGYIYKITNDINDKVYIGKTVNSIEQRKKDHFRDAYKERNEQRPLYNAIRKYGIEHFFFEEVEKIEDNSMLDEREKYWIAFYEGYTKGYNATKGGDGKCLYDHLKILQALLENPRPIEIAKQFGCCVDVVHNIAKQNNITCINTSNERLQQKAKKIFQYTKDKKFIQSFDSTVLAAQWCFDNNYCKALNSGVRSHIAECANGKRKSAYGYIWSYVEL